MRVSMVVAASENNVIGKDNKLPWNLPKDMKYFKNLTNGHPIIMGRKTLEALGKPLPNRTNIVITRQANYLPAGVLVAATPEKALELAFQHEINEAFIIGGGEIFHLMLPLTNRVYLTRVHAIVDGDAYFPVLSPDDWRLVSEEKHEADDKHLYSFSFEVFDRKNKMA